ncbi:MAG TPA: DUF2231 domain-containing protein [Chthoniobacteraceae bacterium]|nr:DUF2231 domain-containing protein [Chthoniobacteraceae bacterium]
MNLDPENWSKLHGAVTHFPIALMLVSAFCDGASLLPGPAERQRALRSAATVTIVLGALGSYAAVATGLLLTKWQVWGHGTLLRHHQFVWPAFALMTGLATWRLAARREPATRPPRVYLALMFLAAALMSGAGYWGGELLNRG